MSFDKEDLRQALIQTFLLAGAGVMIYLSSTASNPTNHQIIPYDQSITTIYQR